MSIDLREGMQTLLDDASSKAQAGSSCGVLQVVGRRMAGSECHRHIYETNMRRCYGMQAEDSRKTKCLIACVAMRAASDKFANRWLASH